MARTKKHRAHVNHERWIVSYADFVTLLFAFFVVMFATANADRNKVRMVSEAIRAALNQPVPPPPPGAAKPQATMPDPSKMAQAMAELMPSMKLLEKELSAEIQNGNVEVHMTPRGLVVSFKQAAFFDSGSDGVKPSAMPTIDKVGRVLSKIPNSVRLEGHTDNVPIATERFRNNWELSSARAIAVLNVLSNECGIPRLRLAVGGYAEVAPVASNDTEAGRARNRRVDVVILSRYGAASEPGANK
jgi:chemotaxis protein MotB